MYASTLDDHQCKSSDSDYSLREGTNIRELDDGHITYNMIFWLKTLDLAFNLVIAGLIC